MNPQYREENCSHDKYVTEAALAHVAVYHHLTFPDQVLYLLVEAQPVALPPQPHVGGVVLPAALIRGAHGEQLPPVPGQEQLLPPAGRAAPAGPQRQAVVGDVDEARVLTTAGKAPAAVSVPPSVGFVPVVGAHRHRQHAQGAQRQREPGVQQQLPGSHARFCHSRISTSTDGQLLCGVPPAQLTSPLERRAGTITEELETEKLYSDGAQQ